MSEDSFDLVIIGGGPGGYVAAIRSAQLGMKVACVDKRDTLGGTCLNVGCIPSKALLRSSHLYQSANHRLAAHGVKTASVTFDLAAMMARKDKVVAELTKGIEFLFKKNKVAHIIGTAAITAANTVTVKAGKGKARILKTENIIIATGSDTAPLAGVEIDEKRIVSSTGALSIAKAPKQMVVIGAGVIGLELGSVWRRLGAEVTVIEFLDGILPGMDGEVRTQMRRILSGQGMIFKLSTKVSAAKTSKSGVSLTVEPVKGGPEERLKADLLLVATGRLPYTGGLGLDKLGVAMDERGFIKVDGGFQSNVAGVFAIGDVIGGAMLAHKAEDEGVAVAEILAGQAGHVNYETIPGVVYTHPEVASVGHGEEKLKVDGIAYNIGKFPFSANARARINADTDGFVKVLAAANSDRLLGVHIVGPAAGELIQEAVSVMEFGGSAEDLARTCHAHPGLYEALKEAALAVDRRAIHI